MDLSEILQSVDIAEYIGQYVDLEEKNGELWGISPFTDPPENTPSFSVRRETGQFYDFSSGNGGNIINFIALYQHVTNGQAVKILKKYAGISDSDDGDVSYQQKMSATKICAKYKPKKHEKREQKSSSIQVLPEKYMDRFENAPEKYQIWRNDGITDEAMSFFGVRYDSFSNCIVYPIKNADGNIVNVGGRTLDPNFKEKGIRKYTYLKPWNGSMAVVYGLYENMDAIKKQHEIILFEGMKSVLLARGFGFNNCGAILTSHLNPSQMNILARLGVDVVFALDKEVDIRKDRNIQTLKKYINVFYYVDSKSRLDDKDAPVDKGRVVFEELYESRRKFK